MATSSATAIDSTSSQNGPAPWSRASGPEASRMAPNSGPETTNATTPASRVRTAPSRRPSSRRTATANSSTVSTAKRATSTQARTSTGRRP